jgi:protocatechuate 3,4-dioxygenase beta subunit
MYTKTLKTCCSLLLVMIMTACGDTLDESGSGGDKNQVYTLKLESGLTSISAGGWTEIIANIIDGNGNGFIAQEVDITFNSTCVVNGKALLDSPVTSVTGTAISTYEAKGCEGDDVIVARASWEEEDITGNTTVAISVSGTITINVAPSTMGAITFVDSTPSMIGIKGAGLPESARVTFRVSDISGGPLARQVVDFSLNSDKGGVSLANVEGTTNQNGEVSVVVNAGTIAATVRVTAALRSNPAIKTQSRGLAISTGVAEQDRFSLSADILNPEAFNYDGTEVFLTVRAADRAGNPVPDNSTVYFTAEGGHVEPSCETENGVCSVAWRSANPRPADGRATVLAVMDGEESFNDFNANGYFDPGESFVDLPDAWRDDNENGRYDAGIEEFRDYDNTGVFSEGDGCFTGVLRNYQPGDACYNRAKSIEVRENLVLVMSGSYADIITPRGGFSSCAGSVSSDLFTIKDARSNPMPAGTKIGITVSFGELVTPEEYIVFSTNNKSIETLRYSVAWKGTKDLNPGETEAGAMTITVTTPNGNQTVKTLPLSHAEGAACAFSPGP